MSSTTVAEGLPWVEENEYDVSSLGEDVLDVYLSSGLNLIAFRLTKDAEVGSIRPVTLTYEAEASVIPIRPTAVAANENMGVLVWVLGSDRAVPLNYYALELNELLIDWFNPNGNYVEVVTAAADEAGGNGFVTEFARRNFNFNLFTERSSWNALLGLTEPEDRLQLLLDSARVLGELDGFADVVRDTVPLREGVTVEDYVRCPSCYFPMQTDETRHWYEGYGYDAGVDAGSYVTTNTYPVFPEDGTDPITTLDSEVYLAALQELVVAPMQMTDELLDQADYMTRLFTTLSPDEMTTDPIFEFNPDLGPVDNVHTRERFVTCDEDFNTTWTMDFDGVAVEGENTTWPIEIGELPANYRILQLSTSGPGDVVRDMSEEIDEMMPLEPEPSSSEPDPGTPDDDERDDDEEADSGNGLGTGASPGRSDAGSSRTDSTLDTNADDCTCRAVGTASSPGYGATLLVVASSLAFRRRRRK